MEANAVIQPWYRQLWPWILISIPLTAVVLGFYMFYLADVHRDDLVTDSYYKEGMTINRKLMMDHQAENLKIKATLKSIGQGEIVFTIENATDSAIQLSLFHVSSSEQDKVVALVPEEGYDYSIVSSEIESLLSSQGVWYLELKGTDSHWRLRKRVVTPLSELEMVPTVVGIDLNQGGEGQ
jgi:hypothetical protein